MHGMPSLLGVGGRRRLLGLLLGLVELHDGVVGLGALFLLLLGTGESHEDVAKVNYPTLPSSPYYKLAQKYFPNGAGSIFSFELNGGYKAARAFIDGAEIFSDLANVGDSKSLLVHPASTTHQQLNEDALHEPKEFPNQGEVNQSPFF